MSSRRGSSVDVAAICDEIKANYSPCDVADALLVINVPGAGRLADIRKSYNQLKAELKRRLIKYYIQILSRPDRMARIE